ncbi:MAG: zinc-binding dehydrogenase, partial [Pseudomonadota bacterium]
AALHPPWFLGSECPGCFAEYVTVAARHAHVIESDLSDIELATFPCSYSTAENMIVRMGATDGERALVTGASGGVGSAAVQLLVARGLDVTAVTSPAKTEALIALGASACLDRGDTPPSNSFDLAIDLAGGPAWTAIIDALKPGGRYAVAGAVAGAEVPLDLRDLYLKDLTFFGCTVLDDGVFSGLVRWIETGAIKPLLAETFALQDIRDAQTAFLERGHIGKIGLRIGSG